VSYTSLGVEESLLVLREQYEHLFYVGFAMTERQFEVVFRPLSLHEAGVITQVGPAIPPFDMNDWIALRGVLSISNAQGLNPTDFINSAYCPAALPDLMAELILGVSGFEDPQSYVDLLDQARAEQQTIQASIENFICAAFPGTKPRDVGDMSVYEQMNMLARAEIMLGRQLDLVPQQKQERQGARLSPEAAAILSQGAADQPEPSRDNARMGQFLTGPERMDTVDPQHEIKKRMRPKLPGAH